MNTIMKKIATVMMTFALVVSAFNAPLVSVANAQSVDDFSFNLPGFDFNFPSFDFGSIPLTSTSCTVTASNTSVFTGGSVDLSWTTSGFDTVSINGQTMAVTNGTINMTNILANTTYTLTAATANGASHCTSTVTVTCVPAPVDCRLEVVKVVDKATASVGDTLTYNITVKNIGTTDCTGSGVKIQDVLSDKLTYLTQTSSSNITAGYFGDIPVYTASDRTIHFNGNVLNPGESGTMTVTARVNTPTSCGNYDITNQARATAKELNNFQSWISSAVVHTAISNGCITNDPAPTCDSLTAAPATITVGGNSTLAWQTSNASRVTINNGVGEVAVDGSATVAPLTTATYILTAFGTQNRTATCNIPVTVTTQVLPVCESFTASPSALGVGGGQTTLTWKVNNATNISIAPTIGTVAAQGSQSTNVTSNTNFVLTASDTNGHQVTCAAPVTVTPPTNDTLTCQNNVTFTASDYSITRGENSVLTWNTTGVDTVSISNINTTSLGGSYTVEPAADTTYTLIATKGAKSVNCPLTIAVTTGGGGGGGGGSSSPRCELSISDNKIDAGEAVTLKWNSTRATDVTLDDNHGKTLVSTSKYTSKEKKDYFDGTLKLYPTRDTEYTFVVEKGSKTRTCKVNVAVGGLKVITDRTPTVAGISLSNVPYTGFEAGPALTILFYVLLTAWALFVTYLIVVRRRPVMGGMTGAIATFPAAGVAAMNQAEEAHPHMFPSEASVVASTATQVFPANLPVAAMAPVIGYGNVVETFNPVNPHHVTNTIVTDLENRAHSQMALLSSDAIRHFIATTEGTLERNEALDTVIAQAKGHYPLEDGWIVINEARMQSLCETCLARVASDTAPFVPTMVPAGSSSLAEAIVTGNIVAAYEMIGNRPMFALADAAADLDAVVRARRGEATKISNLLNTETAKLSEEKIKNMITALTGALDGTYTDEASAVKMAIMKAVKEVA